ncbi:hypothetical protein DW66_3110 [Pseudomonas putida]|nr:hypothetical protein DW66_3110 [Pseudomonas putida]AJG13319.1 hypothetical protein RK21_01811 [Pseudomonas plecoglossicida]
MRPRDVRPRRIRVAHRLRRLVAHPSPLGKTAQARRIALPFRPSP